MIHTVKSFSVVDETEVDALLEFPCFLHDPVNVINLIFGSCAFSKPSLDIWKFLVHKMLKPSMQDSKQTFLAWEISVIVPWCEHSLVLPFLGIEIRIDFFQSFGHCLVFQICWHIVYNTLIALSFRVLNSSTGIPSHPLALLTAVLPKAYLTSHSRTSGSEWLTTLSWLSGSLRSFLYSSSMYSFHLFLISSVSTRSLPFCPLLCPSLGQMFSWYFQFSWRDL